MINGKVLYKKLMGMSTMCYSYPKPLPRLEGALAINNLLQGATRAFQGQVTGPESFAVDENGKLYLKAACM